MKITSKIRDVVREHFFYPTVGRILDRYLRWCHRQDGWEDIASAAAHVLIETSTAVLVRTRLAEVLMDFEPFLSQESVEVLRLLDKIAQKRSPAAN